MTKRNKPRQSATPNSCWFIFQQALEEPTEANSSGTENIIAPTTIRPQQGTQWAHHVLSFFHFLKAATQVQLNIKGPEPSKILNAFKNSINQYKETAEHYMPPERSNHHHLPIKYVCQKKTWIWILNKSLATPIYRKHRGVRKMLNNTTRMRPAKSTLYETKEN